MLPSWQPSEEQADQVGRLFFGADAVLGAAAAAGAPSAATEGGSTAETTSSSSTESSSSSTAASNSGTTQQQQPSAPVPAAAPPPSPLLRLRVALEVLQSFQTRANPSAGLPVWQEASVAAVASLADEMLYRAVALAFLGGWLRDRAYEAGADDEVLFPTMLLGGGAAPGGTAAASGAAADVAAAATAAAGALTAVPTAVAAQYAALGLIAALGVAGFIAKAYQDRRSVERLQVLAA